MHTPGEEPAPRPLRVLLIEDDDAMRAMLADAFRHEGWEVTECESVFRWLQHCVNEFAETSGSGTNSYDVVVSDICMPGMSGLEVMAMLKDMYSAAVCPPTILITAFGDDETHEQARALGAAEVLDKPFDTKHLIHTVREVVRL